ncbi:MAG: EI24 domain-containing protein [Mariprofundus sp.]|nr:EI24 domain-containing protein [Mariprofundus sp.]
MIQGVLSFIAGFRLMFAKAELRIIVWRMLGLLVVLMVIVTAGSFWLLDYLAELWLPQGDAWYWQLLSSIAWLLALLLSMVSGAIAYVALGSAAVAPWLDGMANRTEQFYGVTHEADQSHWITQITTSLSNSVRPLMGLLVWGAAALTMIWLPPLATALWTYGGLRFLSYELMDTTASRQGWDFQRRQEDLKQRRWFYLGFSGIAMILLLVPVVNLFVIPAGVVALSIPRKQLS